MLRDLQFNIERGDRIALLGKNGEGKSTLSRIIASIEPYTGTCRLGHNVTVGYYAQNQADTLKGMRVCSMSLIRLQQARYVQK